MAPKSRYGLDMWALFRKEMETSEESMWEELTVQPVISGPFIRKGLAQIFSCTGVLCFPDSHSKVVSLYLAFFFLVHSSLIFKIILMIFNSHCLTSYLLVPILKLPMVLSSVAQSCPTLCDPMDCSTPGLPVHHQLPEFTQTHVHWVSDAIQPSHPLLSPSPPAFNLSQHQGLFQWVSSSHQVAKVLELQLTTEASVLPNEYSGLISFRIDWLDLLAVQGTLKSLL